MALSFMKGNYVKFVRGTTALWNSLVVKDADTLYFIIDNGQAQGTLYLGSTLIAGQIDTPTFNMSSLEDVILRNIGDKEILVYNATSQKWENTTLPNAIGQVVKEMQGATAEADGAAGLVPQPMQDDRDLFLQGNGRWANPTAAVEVTLNTLIGADAGKSIREIATDEASSAVAKIVDGADEAFDTLKEISDWIISHPEVDNVVKLEGRVTTLEEALNGKDDGTEGLISKVNNINVILKGNDGNSGLVKAVELVQDKVGDLSTLVEEHTTTINEHTEQINAMAEALTWQVMTETEE